MNTYKGNFAGMFLPAGIGGDFVRLALLRQWNIPLDKAAASIGMERALGLLALVVTANLGLLAAPWLSVPVLSQFPPIIIGSLVALSAALVVSFRPWATRLIPFEPVRQLIAAYQSYAHHKRALLVFFLLSIVEVMVVVSLYHICGWAVGGGVPGYFQLLVIMPIVIVFLRLPISVAGIGLQESLFGVVLVSMGSTLESALLLSFIMHVLQVASIAPAGLLFLHGPRNSRVC